MLTPEQLSEFPDVFESLFVEFDEFVIRDYARRLKKTGIVTDTAEWMAIRAEELGLSKEVIDAESRRILQEAEAEVDKTMNKVATTSRDADLRRFKSTGLTLDRIANNAFLQAYIESAIRQTSNELINLSGTLGMIDGSKATTIYDFYVHQLDFAQLKISSGVQDYNSAIRDAVKAVSSQGVQVIDYESGAHMNVASASRRAVLTGINQMAKQMNDAICDELGLDLVEVTAHAGARPTHAEWHGQVYSRSGTYKETGYANLYDATGLGRVDGLCGANCRHNYYGYFEGSPRAYTKEYLDHLDDPIEIDGKEYTPYEASQRQRYMERQMRKTKREIVAYEEADMEDEFVSSSIKLRRQREAYREFSSKAGLRPKFERVQEISYNRSVASKSSHAARREEKRNGKQTDA